MFHPNLVARNLGNHILVSSNATGMVAICLHPLDLPGTEWEHARFNDAHIDWVRTDTPVECPILNLREAEYRAVCRALRIAGGNKSEASKLMGLKRTTFVELAKRVLKE